MKKLLLMMSILLSAGMFCACSNDDEMNVNGGGELLQIPDSTLIPDDGVVLSPINFWNEDDIIWNTELYPKLNPILGNIEDELPLLGQSKGFFVGSEKSECYVINSLEELKSIYTGDLEMPETGFFEQYTLVIGQEFMPDCNYPVYKQDLMFNDHKCHLTLYVPDYEIDSGYKPLQHLYYFGVYPKFYTEDISVGIIKEESVLESVEDVRGLVWINTAKDWDWYKDRTPYDGYPITVGPEGATPDYYFPINFPNDFVVDEFNGNIVKFSGKIIELHREALDQLQAPRWGWHHYIVYLTKIEETD